MKSLLLTLPLAFASLTAVAAPQSRDDRYYDDRYYAAYDTCSRCGEVVRINHTGGGHSTSGVGAVTGAVIGGLLGNQVGGGSGKKVATVAGAVAGGVAGNRIERNRSGGGYEVVVQMDDGRRIVVRQSSLNGIDEGERVYVSGGRARLL